jgi:cytochrome c
VNSTGTALAAILLAGPACAAPPREAARGERLYRQCVACHALEPGRNTPAGPTLHAIVGRAIAGETGFNYSPAMRRFAYNHQFWTPELLDRFLANPGAVVPGSEMGFAGLVESDDRRTLIEWLDTGQVQSR